MRATYFFINPQTQILRSGWRVLLFATIALLPRLATAFFAPASSAPPENSAEFAVDGAMIVVYLALILWVALISWFCLRFFEGLPWASLGYWFHRGWLRDVLSGLLLGVLMVVGVVLVQKLSGGTQIGLNPSWWKAEGITTAGWRATLAGFAVASGLLLVAAAFEEIVFRGYVLQTLLRDVPAAVPIVLLAVLFGLAHWSNPSRTAFSTLNTVLAGIWLALAYLKTRSLWLATALHFAWNWTMGLVFGLPVSGMLLRNSLLISTSQTPVWLTGGSYGCEGGLTATLAFSLALLALWRIDWLRPAPEMIAYNQRAAAVTEPPLRLDLTSNE